MAKEETNISQQCRLEASKLGTTLFRNNRGCFYTLDGVKALISAIKRRSLSDALKLVSRLRIVRAGLEADGSSDFIGWTPIKITESMVGRTVAVFTAPEVKTPTGRVSEAQKKFIKAVNLNGGIAGVVRSTEDVRKLLTSVPK